MDFVNQILLPLIATVLTSLIIWGITTFVDWLKTKTHAAVVDDILSSADQIITNTVAEVSQTFVDNLKKEGKFDAAAQKAALNKAYNKITYQLTDEMKETLQTRCEDLTGYIITLIESKVKGGK